MRWPIVFLGVITYVFVNTACAGSNEYNRTVLWVRGDFVAAYGAIEELCESNTTQALKYLDSHLYANVFCGLVAQERPQLTDPVKDLLCETIAYRDQYAGHRTTWSPVLKKLSQALERGDLNEGSDASELRRPTVLVQPGLGDPLWTSSFFLQTCKALRAGNTRHALWRLARYCEEAVRFLEAVPEAERERIRIIIDSMIPAYHERCVAQHSEGKGCSTEDERRPAIWILELRDGKRKVAEKRFHVVKPGPLTE